MNPHRLFRLFLLLACWAVSPSATATLVVFGNGSTYMDGDNMGTKGADVAKAGNSVSVHALRSANVSYFDVTNQPQSYHTEVELVGGGYAGYGALGASMSAHVIARSGTSTGSFAEARVLQGTIQVGYNETAIVQSATLALGTPVTLNFTAYLSSSYVFTKNPPTPDSDNAAGVNYIGNVTDQATGANKGFTLANGTGGTTPSLVTLTIESAVGNSIGLWADLTVGAVARVHDFGTSSQTEISAAVNAANTGRFYFTPADGSDLKIIGASGHDYATVPEPSALLLLAVGSLSLAGRRTRRAHRD